MFSPRAAAWISSASADGGQVAIALVGKDHPVGQHAFQPVAMAGARPCAASAKSQLK